MNKHILMVMGHLKNPGKYTTEELKANARAANINATRCCYDSHAGAHAAYAADAAHTNVHVANAVTPAFWVDRYFIVSSDNRADYEKELNDED